MFFSRLQKQAALFFIGYFCFFPGICFAFEVSPSVSDLSFSGHDEVVQLISVVNTGAERRVYEAKVQLITFASDGSIEGFSDVPGDFGASVLPQSVSVSADSEQVFTVTFSHPEKVTPDQVFGLVIHEQGSEVQQLSSAFVALMFPEGIVLSDTEPSFRIDAFTIASVDGALQVVTQFTNTGDIVVKPASILIAQDFFGRELARSVFADQGGRLPVGTTRVITDVLPYDHFGFWHVGGPVLFSLLSVADAGGTVQQASVEFMTTPGNGVIAIVMFVALFFIGGIIFLLKRRGILRS